MTVRLAIANQKGGVGKTTTAVNLGSALARRGRTVLLVDLDPQANATSGLGLSKDEPASIYEVLLAGATLESVARPTPVPQMRIAPSSTAMAGVEVELVPEIAREMRLRQALDGLGARYDVILVDSPPSLGLLTVNALAACERVLIPLQCEYYALEGLAQLVGAIALVRERLNPELRVFGVLMTMEDRRNRLTEQVVAEVRKHFRQELFQTRIPRAVRLAEAPSHGVPVDLYDAGSRGTAAYGELAREVLARLRAEQAAVAAPMAVANG